LTSGTVVASLGIRAPAAGGAGQLGFAAERAVAAECDALGVEFGTRGTVGTHNAVDRVG